MKVFSFEIYEGDRGVIIAKSYKKAKKILKKEYDIYITDDDIEWQEGKKALLYEIGKLKKNTLYVNVAWWCQRKQIQWLGVLHKEIDPYAALPLCCKWNTFLNPTVSLELTPGVQ